MGDPREPPEGTPEGGSGNEDEFRSVVFDESFVRAARIQELSARERLGGNFSRATRPRIGLGPLGSLPRQAVALLLLVVLAFAAAVYFGVSSPHRQDAAPSGNQLTTSLVALTPPTAVGSVPDPKNPFAVLPTGFADGAAGLGLPTSSATSHFTRIEVSRALDTVKSYLVASSMTPATVAQSETGAVRALITPGEQAQYDESINAPRDDQHHAATGWLVRFDPGQVALASDTVKVAGAIQVTEAPGGTLEITADHTLVYALRPAGTDGATSTSLFQVRRALRFEFDHSDIGEGRLRLVDAVVQAGPTGCGAAGGDYLQPLLAGRSGTTPSVVSPADRAHPAWQVCGVLGPIGS
jgi:hypothetical protein